MTTQDGTWDRDSAAYQARCRELYNTWKSSEDVSGNYDSDGAPGDAIREYGDMLCDQS